MSQQCGGTLHFCCSRDLLPLYRSEDTVAANVAERAARSEQVSNHKERKCTSPSRAAASLGNDVPTDACH
jgi:hypothetical protein